MDKVVIPVFMFAILLPAIHAITTPASPPGDECTMWKSVTNNLTHNPAILMHCSDYSSCNGFDCAATFSYNGLITNNKNFSLNFCFGLVLNQCDSRMNMVTFIEVPDKNVNFTQKYYNDETYEIPGLTYDFGAGTAAAFVDVTLEKSDDRKFLTIGLLLKVRVKISRFPAQWPDELQRDVVPPTTIPVPPCTSKAQTTPPRHRCVPPKEHSGVHPSSPTTSGPPKGHTGAPPTGSPPVKPHTGRPHPHTQQPPVKGEKCKPGFTHQCGQYGMCSYSGICGCMPGFAFSATSHSCTAQVNQKLGNGCELGVSGECGDNAFCKRKSPSSRGRGGVCACDVSIDFFKTSVRGGSACVPGNAPKTSKGPAVVPVTPQGKGDHGKDASGTTSTSNTVAIAASVGSIGFVLLVAGLVGAAIFIRRRRLRYRDHDVLLTTGDEGDDEPI